MNETNQMAMVSIIAAAVAWVIGALGSCALLFFFPPAVFCTLPLFGIGCIVAVVTGHMGRNQIKENLAQEGDNLALTGLVLGWTGLVLTVLSVCCTILFTVFGVTLLGPELGNVFSEIERSLATPTGS